VRKVEERKRVEPAAERPATLEVETLLADVDQARAALAAAERRARTYLVRHGKIDQIRGDLASLLRDTLGEPEG